MTPPNRQILLRARPSGAATDDLFEAREQPASELTDGQALGRVLYVSIDPTIRGWIERDTYLPKVELGEVVRSAGLAEIVESKTDTLEVGDRVLTLTGWQQYCHIDPAAKPTKLPPGIDPTDALSIFGVTGLTAYFGLLDVGKPVEGETVVVSGAAGATGSVAGQIAKIKGCRVVGIAGTDDKCRWLTDACGFDAAINYKTEDVRARIKETCPKGVNLFFDNVGGPILDAVLMNLAMRGRVVLCGAISQYNDFDDAYGPKAYFNLISRRGRMEGFLVMDYVDRAMPAVMELASWVGQGKIQYRKTVLEGLDQAPEALRRLFTGDHDGKLMVKIAD